MKRTYPVLIIAGLLMTSLFSACQPEKPLPFLGQKEMVEQEVDGKTVEVEMPIPLPPFSFTDQEGRTVTEATLEGKVHVADFFFTSCPTICPKMKKQMKRMHDAFDQEPDLLLLSHTIDPKHDSVAVLKRYADRLGIDGNRWRMMTGDKDDIYAIAKAYMIQAAEDASAPGGYIHSGAFLLFDREHRIRGFYDGTEPTEVDKLMKDIKRLLKES